MKHLHKFAALLAPMLLVLLLLGSAPSVAAQDVKITTPFPQIEVNTGQTVQLTVTITNLGADYQTLSLEVAAPDNWEATLKSGGYLVKMVTIAPFENQQVTLTVTQPAGVDLGTYTIEITALDESKVVKDTLDVIVDVAEVSPLGLSLSATNTSIEGPAGKAFQFSAYLVNETGEVRDIELSYVAPANWTVTFTSGYETTLVRAVRVEAGARQSLKITVTPTADAGAATYPISIVASSGPYSQTLDLSATITGTYTMSLSTSDGLLNLSAPQGESTPITVVVTNTGSGRLEQLAFRSTKPSGWEVTFEPTDVSAIEPKASAQVIVRIKPASDAIPGDYSLTLTAYTSGSNAVSQQLSLRVTVLGSAAWGLVGLLIIVVVIAGMVFIFWRLGRR